MFDHSVVADVLDPGHVQAGEAAADVAVLLVRAEPDRLAVNERYEAALALTGWLSRWCGSD